MATPLQQQTRQRKMIYFGAIVVLFTLSLIHREFIVKPQAYRLQLREESRGEVELTSSAVRLILIGSRGVAVTMLWYNAMEKQKRNEWHEMELIVKSITKLQPYFITPWLYQSWNISFNVAVECDRPRDKYHYISRGLELLGEGERRNRGTEEVVGGKDAKRTIYPGNPEMRHYMGFFYQLKIGSSDERLTMRTLLELSCIDPIERNPERFWIRDAQGRKEVNTGEFLKFAKSYPRTIRRLREQLDYADPKRIVQFLQEYQDIPSRFKKSTAGAVESELKDPLEQFPILPPPEGTHWPDPRNRDLRSQSGAESVDVFAVSRTWYEFAQKPLPPPDDNPRPIGQEYDKSLYRIPKQMVTQLFRQYPARAQVYIAEGLESEGFFDDEGWDVVGAFEKLSAAVQAGETERIGTDSKYHSVRAWDKGHKDYKQFGRENGLYIPPGDAIELEKKAIKARKGLNLQEDETPANVPAEWRTGDKAEWLDAHLKLRYSRYFRRLANYAAFYDQSEGEKDPLTGAARKLLFAAERKRKGGAPSEAMLREYDRAWALYIQAALKHPRFAQVSSMQEDLCEIHQRYLDAAQKLHSDAFRKRAVMAAKIGFSPYSMEAGRIGFYTPEQIAQSLAFWPPTDWRGAIAGQVFNRDQMIDDVGSLNARLAYWPLSSWRDAIVRHHLVTTREKDEQQMLKVVPIRTRLGLIDQIEYYDGPMAKEMKEEFLFRWATGAMLSQNMSVAGTITFPGHEFMMLSRIASATQEKTAKDWVPLITEESRRITADRLGLR